jgi:glutamine amidotransferase
VKRRVTVIDYGVGNLHNVCCAFEHCGAEVILATDADRIIRAERLVLPGVGAFADGMHGLQEIGAVDAIRLHARSGRPFLGICLGMQMMLDRSSEFGSTGGLSLLPGEVVPIPALGEDGAQHKIPRIGWEQLLLPEGRADWEKSILQGVTSGQSVYFVHSFMAAPANPQHRLADYDYDGIKVCAAIQNGNLYGCQFHPEKSGEVGLEILRNFVAF